MKSKRFIFTISEDQDKFLKQESSSRSTSKSKVISQILTEHISQKKINLVHTYKKEFDHNDKNSHTSAMINKLLYDGDYETLSQEIVSNIDMLVKVSDLDFLLYLTSQLLVLFPQKGLLTISQAKILSQKGLLMESTDTLNLKTFGKDDFYKYIILAEISISRGKIISALDYLNKTQIELNVWNTVDDLKSRKETYIIIKAEYLWIAEGVNSALKYIEVFISKEGQSRVFLGKAYCLKGDFLRDKGSYQESELSYRKGLRLLENLSDGKYKARALRGLGSVYKKKNDTSNATKYIFQALEVSKKYKDRITTGSILGSVGSLYQSLGEMNLAEKAFHEKWEIGSRANSLRETFYANYDRTINLLSTGQYDNASKVLLETKKDAKLFRRKYYMDIWEGYLLSSKNFDLGIKTIENAKKEAVTNNEKRQVNIANYVQGVAQYLNGTNKNKNSEIFNTILNDPEVSIQLKSNVKKILKGSKAILPI